MKRNADRLGAPKYNLAIESTVDLTQTSNIFPLGASLSGVGNFKGTVSGEGETYRVDGTVDSEAISAEGVYLRAVNVTATVEGTNSSYEANGKAVAELLTFEDFRIDFLRLSAMSADRERISDGSASFRPRRPSRNRSRSADCFFPTQSPS